MRIGQKKSRGWGLENVRRRCSACRKTFFKESRVYRTCRNVVWRRTSPRIRGQHWQLRLMLDTTHSIANIPRSGEQRHLFSSKTIKKPEGWGKRRHSRPIDSLHYFPGHDHDQQITRVFRDLLFDVHEINEKDGWRTRCNQEELPWSNSMISAGKTKHTIGINLQKLNRRANSNLLWATAKTSS